MSLVSVLAQTGIVPIDTPAIDWVVLTPLLIISVGALLMLMFASLLRSLGSTAFSLLTALIAGASAASVIPLWQRLDGGEAASSTLAGAVSFDGFSLFLTVVIALAVGLSALLADDYLTREDLDQGPELYVLLMLSGAGGIIMGMSNDLIVLFLGLEILSIAVYILAAMHVRRMQSLESGMKYFVLGAFSSAFFLYGIAMVYGATGSTNLIDIKNFLAGSFLTEDAMLLAGFALLLVGLAFKVAAVPFHFWTPDVYQGAPTPVVAYMASGVKVAGFAAIIRVFVLTFDQFRLDWQPVIYALAIASLLVGSFLAIVQTNVKRMLAYSSVSHAGFILVGVQAATDRGTAAVLFYLAAYTFMVIGSFGVLTVAGGEGDDAHTLDDYKGLSDRSPFLAFALMVFLFAQAGVPLTTGFFAKFSVIAAAIDARSFWLAVVAMVAAAVAAFLYLRIIVSMFFSSDDDEVDDLVPADGEVSDEPSGTTRIDVPAGARIAITLCLLVTVVFGVWPGPIDDLAREAIPRLVAEAAAFGN